MIFGMLISSLKYLHQDFSQFLNELFFYYNFEIFMTNKEFDNEIIFHLIVRSCPGHTNYFPLYYVLVDITKNISMYCKKAMNINILYFVILIIIFYILYSLSC